MTKQEALKIAKPILFNSEMVRAYTVLKRAGYKTLGEVSGLTWDKLLQLRSMGRKSAEEVIKKLEEHGLKLRGEVNGDENI